MRIGFDVSPLHRPHPPGVVRVTRGLVTALERRGRIEVVRLAPAPTRRIGAWRQFDLPRLVREHGLSGIHSPVSAIPFFSRGARVQTIHEVPWLRGAHENAGARHRLWASVGPLRADAVLCPSAMTAEFVRAGSPLATDKVHVCPWGVDAAFSATPHADDDVVLERLALRDLPFVIASGSVREKKNLAAVLSGVSHAARACRVVVTGPLTAHALATVARFPDVDVRLTGEVDDVTLAVLMRRALAVAVLSKSEGFGLPVIEAQSSGTPVIVSSGSTQADIAGSAALVVDAHEPYEFAAAIERAATDRTRIAHAGLSHAARFTWDRCAEQVERIWESYA